MSKVNKDELVRLYGEGLGINRLAVHFGVNINAIYKHVKNLGLADHTRIPEQKVDETELRQLVAEGLGYLRISKRLNVHQTTVEKHMRRLGLNDPDRQYKKQPGSRRQKRRPKSVEFLDSTKKARFIAQSGRCEECGLQIHDGENWRLAVYHHRKPVVEGGGRDPENCMVLHYECHNDPEIFRRLHGYDRAKMEERWARQSAQSVLYKDCQGNLTTNVETC